MIHLPILARFCIVVISKAYSSNTCLLNYRAICWCSFSNIIWWPWHIQSWLRYYAVHQQQCSRSPKAKKPWIWQIIYHWPWFVQDKSWLGKEWKQELSRSFRQCLLLHWLCDYFAYAGSPIVWAFQDADFALSSEEAEHIVLSRGLHIMIHFINLFWWSWQESKEFLPIYNSHGLCQVFENNAACIESAKEPSYHLGLSTPWQFNCFTFIVSSPQAHSWCQTYQQHKWMNCRYIHQATLCSALRYLRENLIGVWIKGISRECAKFRHSVYQPSPIT